MRTQGLPLKAGWFLTNALCSNYRGTQVNFHLVSYSGVAVAEPFRMNVHGSSLTLPGVGRPRKNIDIDYILELRSLNYSWTKIAALMEISRSTLYRKLEEEGISPNDRTHLSDAELDDIIRSIKQDHPNDGEVLIQAHLVRMRIRITRQALHNSIHRVDHTNVIMRRRNVIRRRVYSVPFPNSVWHIDGHHKIVRWRFVIHGGIDGFSRTVVFLKCSDNNRASTVVKLFQEGASRFGLPDRVRTDHGGENVGVWRYMLASHNHDHSCIVTGSSVHNERVERLWRDVNRCIASSFADVFRILEREDKLDPLNEVDLYCLHYVFLPRINKAIHEFQESWNYHTLSTEGNKSPYQLFLEGMQHEANTSNLLQQLDSAIDVSELTGDHVAVPRIKFTPCSLLERRLQIINPLQPCSDKGVSLYIRAIEISGLHLGAQCNQCSLHHSQE